MLSGRIGIIALISTILAGSSSGATFTFDNIPNGSPLPFTDTEGGVTATFTDFAPRPFEADGYVGGPAELGSNGFIPNGVGKVVRVDIDNSLVITFDRNVDFVSLAFEVLSGTGGYAEFLFGAAENGTSVGEVDTYGGANYSGDGGVVEFGGTDFNEIGMEGSQFGLAIGNLQVAVPEPSTLGLLLIAGCGLLSVGLRQSRPSDKASS